MPNRWTILFVAHALVVAAGVLWALAVARIHPAWVAAGLLLYLAFFALVVVRIVRHIWHFPIPSFLTEFIDNPMRRQFLQNPDRIASRMRLRPGMTVVEIGPGKGSYTKAVAAGVRPGGMVYAADISERVIARLRERMAREGVENVEPRIENAHAFTFADGTVDRVFAVTCLPEIPDPVRVLRECRRILKPDGMVCLCELLLDPDYPLRSTEKRWAAEAGLVCQEEYGSWVSYQLHFGRGD